MTETQQQPAEEKELNWSDIPGHMKIRLLINRINSLEGKVKGLEIENKSYIDECDRLNTLQHLHETRDLKKELDELKFGPGKLRTVIEAEARKDLVSLERQNKHLKSQLESTMRGNANMKKKTKRHNTLLDEFLHDHMVHVDWRHFIGQHRACQKKELD